MYALLLVLGAVITIAGVVLLGAGMPVGGRFYDPTVIMPGTVAVIGGLLLLGLGFTVHVLGRIERALAARPLAHSAHADGTAATAVSAEPPSLTPMVMPPPLPVLPPALEPETQPAAAAAPAVAAEDAAGQQQRVQDKFPALVRLDNAVAIEEAEVALPKNPTRVEALGGFNAVPASQAPRGPVPPPRAVPRRDPPIRTAARPERRSLDSVWPKRPTPIRSSPPAQSAEPIIAAEPVPPPEPVPLPEPIELAMPAEPAPSPPAQLREPMAKPYTNGAGAESPVPVSILKSGIVDGMAYTLYSDGSIEAQLRDGTLRFNSITELRNHVEQNS